MNICNINSELWQNSHVVPITRGKLVNPDVRDQWDHARGFKDLQWFLDTVYCGVLSVLCHIDVGLIFDKNGNPSYFVNEIEHTPTMSMWLKVIYDINNRIDTFTWVLHTYYMNIEKDLYTY